MVIVALFAQRVQQHGALVARSDVWDPIAAPQHRDKNRPEVALSFVFIVIDKRPLLITAVERPHDAT